MSLLLEHAPTDQGYQKLLSQHLRTILEVVDELASQMPLEAQIWSEQVRKELHAGVELIEQEICTLHQTLTERDQRIIELQARLAQEKAGEHPIADAPDSPLVQPIQASTQIPAQSSSDTLENLFEDLEFDNLEGVSAQKASTLLDEPAAVAVVKTEETLASELEVTETVASLVTEAAAPPSASLNMAESVEFETLAKEFQQLQTDLAQQKQQLDSITSVVDKQKTENQQLRSLVSSLQEKLSEKETDLEKSMIRALLLEAGLDPDAA
jgi:septal ring factor EnvC (AmiA/AmiB activator)